jgi:hypothetical protein
MTTPIGRVPIRGSTRRGGDRGAQDFGDAVEGLGRGHQRYEVTVEKRYVAAFLYL